MQFKKLKIAFVTGAVLANLVSSVNVLADNSFIAGLVKSSILLDIDVSETTTIVGERGHVLVSATKSADFVQVSVPTKTTLTGVTSNQDRRWAVGHDATILYSPDKGQSWQVQLEMPELDRPFLDVLFFDKQHGIAVGAYGLFYRTKDAGQTWRKELHASVLPQDDIDYLETVKSDINFYNEELSFILPHFNRLSYANGRLIMSGEAGLIAFSDDLGVNWQRQEIDYQGSFFDAVTLENNVIIAAGLRGNLYAKQAASDEWEHIETCITTSLSSIINGDGDKLIVTGNNGVLLAIEKQTLFTDKRNSANSDSCNRSAAVTMVTTGINDAILNAAYFDNQLVAVTASGIKQLSVK